MPRYPGGDYYLPPGTEAAPDTTIESTRYNVFTADVETEFNNMSDLINLALSDPVTGLPTKVSKAGDTMTGALILSGDPTAPLQAATKQYAVARAGDTMTGHLTLPITPAAANAVRKDYVDAADATLATSISTGDALKVAKAGDTMTGALTTPNELRIMGNGNSWRSRASDYGVMFHNNGGSSYLLLTNNGDPDGTFNGLRPFQINNANGNVNMSNALGVGGTVSASFGNFATGWDATCVDATLNYGGNGGLRVIGNTDPFISFHTLSRGFATNFGLGNDNNMRWGGWSNGGNYWMFWTEKHTGWPLSNGRLPYAGDQALGWPSSPYTESVAHALLSGGTASNIGYGNNVTGFRYRLVQGFTSGWFTFAYA